MKIGTDDTAETLRDLKKINIHMMPNSDEWIQMDGSTHGWFIRKSTLVALAQLAVLPGDEPPPQPTVDENSFVGRYGEWTTLCECKNGWIVEHRRGVRYVRCCRCENPENIEVIGLSTGATIHLPAVTEVREIILPEPQPQLDNEALAGSIEYEITNRPLSTEKLKRIKAILDEPETKP